MKQSFRDYLNEDKLMTIEEYMKEVEYSFLKHFPNGYIKIKEKEGFSGKIISCSIGMIGDEKDNYNGYHTNDNMGHQFMMFEGDNNTWKFEGSGKIYIKPAKDSRNAMDSIKTKMGNNSKITLEKASIKMKKFFKKLSNLMEENKDNIFNVDDIKPKYLIFK